MKNNILINRIILILSIFIFCSFSLFVGSSYATSFSFVNTNNDSVEFTLPLDCVDYIIFSWDSEDYYLLYSTSHCYWAVDNINGSEYRIRCYSDNTYTDTISYKRIDAGNSADFINLSSYDYETYSSAKNILYSNVDIVNKANNNEIFFQGAPKNLVQVMEREQMEVKTLKQIILILPLTLVVVVSFLGLRKALNWLLKLLKCS